MDMRRKKLIVNPFVSVGPIRFGMTFDEARAALPGLGPDYRPEQNRYVQSESLVVVSFDEEGFVKGVDVTLDHGRAFAELDGLPLEGERSKLTEALKARGVRTMPNMPPYPAGASDPMLHLPDYGVNISLTDEGQVEFVWAGRRDQFVSESQGSQINEGCRT